MLNVIRFEDMIHLEDVVHFEEIDTKYNLL
jgi:hypothetical protein